MSGGDILTLVTVFVLAAFVGFEMISKVPSVLHTPLMSGTNAIHGVVLVGSMIVLGEAKGTGQVILGFVAVVLATVNVVGGFVVTDRMLEMFKGRQPKPATVPAAEKGPSAAVGPGGPARSAGPAGVAGVPGSAGPAGPVGAGGAAGSAGPASPADPESTEAGP